MSATVTAIATLAFLGVLSLSRPTQAQTAIGKLHVSRYVDVSRDSDIRRGTSFATARPQQALLSGQTIRTHKRSHAQVDFPDNSVLRINERSVLTVHGAATSHQIELETGAIWLRIPQGTKAVIQTPLAVLEASETTFALELEFGRELKVIVLDGSVSLTHGETVLQVPAKRMLSVHRGQATREETPLPFEVLWQPWWESMRDDLDLSVTMGTNAIYDQRTDPLIEGLRVRTTPPPSQRFIDRAEDTPAFVIAGVLLERIADNTAQFSKAELDGSLYGQSTFPDIVGGRGQLRTHQGSGQVTLEANLLSVLSGASRGSQFKALSVAQIEHPIGDRMLVFAGRRRFYAGPVFTDMNESQLIADRYTGFGATFVQHALRLEGAFLYDASSDLPGVQHGALASLTTRAWGRAFGVHYLRAAGSSRGYGYSVSAVTPLLSNELEGYAEIGTASDGNSIQTFGLYFPGLFQKREVDLTIEHSYHQGRDRSTTVAAHKTLRKDMRTRAYIDLSESNVRLGLGLLLNFK